MDATELIIKEIQISRQSSEDNGMAIAGLQAQIDGINARLDRVGPIVQVFMNTSAGIGRLLFASSVSRGLSTLIVLMLISICSLAAMTRAGFGVQEAIGNVDTMINSAERMKSLVPGDTSFTGPPNAYAAGLTEDVR